MTRRATLTPADTRAVLQTNAPEKELQKHLEEMLSQYGWRWHHETDSRKSKAGWPDLVAVRITNRFDATGQPVYPWVLFLEVKTETGKLKPEQAALWQEFAALDASSTGEVRYRIVRPSNLATIEEWIRGNA